MAAFQQQMQQAEQAKQAQRQYQAQPILLRILKVDRKIQVRGGNKIPIDNNLMRLVLMIVYFIF